MISGLAKFKVIENHQHLRKSSYVQGLNLDYNSH
jgi:hypothetical protein